MQRLITAYRKLPSPSNRAKLQAYIIKHPMSVCLIPHADIHFLRVNNFTI
jgi:hypothetical protein